MCHILENRQSAHNSTFVINCNWKQWGKIHKLQKKIMWVFIVSLVSELRLQWINPGHQHIYFSIRSSKSLFHLLLSLVWNLQMFVDIAVTKEFMMINEFAFLLDTLGKLYLGECTNSWQMQWAKNQLHTPLYSKVMMDNISMSWLIAFCTYWFIRTSRSLLLYLLYYVYTIKVKLCQSSQEKRNHKINFDKWTYIDSFIITSYMKEMQYIIFSVQTSFSKFSLYFLNDPTLDLRLPTELERCL